KAKEVTFANAPSFLLKSIESDVDGIGLVSCDIAYGGNFYGIIDERTLNIPLVPENASTIIDQAITIRKAINEQVEVVHLAFSFINGMTHIECCMDRDDSKAVFTNTVVVSPGGIDRSPCGT